MPLDRTPFGSMSLLLRLARPCGAVCPSFITFASMNELSYAAALDAGLEPITYRSDALDALGEGEFKGKLDGLVWSKRQPCLMALVTLESGVRVQVIGFQRHSRRGLPEYLGLRLLTPGQQVILCIDRGVRGGLRPSCFRRRRPSFPSRPAMRLERTGDGQFSSVPVNGASLGTDRRRRLLRSFVQPGKDAAVLDRPLVVASSAQIQELLFQQPQLCDAF